MLTSGFFHGLPHTTKSQSHATFTSMVGSTLSKKLDDSCNLGTAEASKSEKATSWDAELTQNKAGVGVSAQ